MTFSQKLVLAVFRPLLNALFSWEVVGIQNVPLTGPLILASNHVHVLDPLFIVFGFPRWVSFVAKEELFRSPFLRAWLRWAGSLSIRRVGRAREKQELLKSARDTLERGSVLGVFPEGSRSRDGRLREGKPGCAVIASQADVPVLPVGIAGTDRIDGISWLWRRPRVVISIGKPFRVATAGIRMSRSQRRSTTAQIMKEIAALLPPEYRGVYHGYED
jgi:1-acyl-sn-glycerol-3-phosphate acyltransferase